jgi:hypothetical protein
MVARVVRPGKGAPARFCRWAASCGYRKLRLRGSQHGREVKLVVDEVKFTLLTRSGARASVGVATALPLLHSSG